MAESITAQPISPSVRQSNIPSKTKTQSLYVTASDVPSVGTLSVVFGTAAARPSTFADFDSGLQAPLSALDNVSWQTLHNGNYRLILSSGIASLSAQTVGHHFYVGLTSAAVPAVSGTAIDVVQDCGALTE